jgi:membrane-associated phospholipid phosphatase
VLAFACCAALVALSVLFVDKKFALQMHTSFHDTPVYRTALGSFLLFEIGGMALLVAALAILALRAKRLTRWMLQLVAGAATGAGALIVAESLKASLGRTPVYPTFLVEGVSAFHPLHRGSFPSATTACVTAVMTVASASWPWGRLAWGIIALLAPLMILITNSHWLSDVIAGAFLGWGLGVATAGIILRRFPGFQDSHGGRR